MHCLLSAGRCRCLLRCRVCPCLLKVPLLAEGQGAACVEDRGKLSVVSHSIVPKGTVVMALHARSVESTLLVLVTFAGNVMCER